MSYRELWHQLSEIYSKSEAQAIARLVFDVCLHLSMADICCGKDKQLSQTEEENLQSIAARLLKNEPVQYVLGQADFCGNVFAVEEGCLIPRPETAELCGWIADDWQKGSPSILDIGTGSGCIAVTLAKNLENAEVTAWDISPKALAIAGKNAERLHAKVHFAIQNALNPPCDNDRWQVIVSNPPYICNKEKAAMQSNVLDYEPSLALFVPDNDPLLFYRHIAQYAQKALAARGTLYFELNPIYAESVKSLVEACGFESIEIRKDFYGKERMIKGTKSA